MENQNIESKQLLDQLQALLDHETDWIAVLCNTSAWLNLVLDRINWVGFYLLKEETLILGPFQGKPACFRIPVGKGVCGTAVIQRQTQRVADVHQFPGHIACDSASRSELVCPIFYEKKVLGVLDIDSFLLNRFDRQDQWFMEQVAELLGRHYARCQQK